MPYYVIIQLLIKQLFFQMVKIQAFKGYTYKSGDYESLLRFNHETLNNLDQNKRAYINKVPIVDQIQSGLLERDTDAFVYVYRQVFQGKESLGLMGELDLQESIDGKIKIHQKTLCREGYDSQSYSKAHVGPIILSYETPSRLIEDSLADITNSLEPYSQWKTVDGRTHAIWKITPDTLPQLFSAIEFLYVMDGHHRLKAATEWYQQSGFCSSTKFAQVLIYPPKSVQIYPFHRLLTENEECSFLKTASEKGLKPVYLKYADESTLNEYQVLYKTHNGYYGFNFEQPASQSLVDKLSVQKLKANILDNLYGTQIESKIDFVPGVMPWKQLNHKYSNLCMVRSIKIEEIFRVADKQETMPAKSTWFQPKPCNQMVVRLPFSI